MNKLFFTSDVHFLHQNIIKYSSRPFTDVNHMSTEIIRIWNETVDDNDDVYLLGDIALTNKKTTKTKLNELFDLCIQLNGKIHVIPGNHDYSGFLDLLEIELGWEICDKLVEKQFEITIDGETYKIDTTSCHFPMKAWNGSEKGSFHFFAHTHGDLKEHELGSIEVGWDVWGKPMLLEDLVQIIHKQRVSGKTHYYFNA